MAAPTKSISAGGKYTFIGFYNTDSEHLGGNTTGPSAGSSLGFRLLEGLKSAAPATPEPETVQITGDDELLGEFDFDSIEQRRFTAELAVWDADLDAYLLGVNVRSVAGGNFVAGDIANAPQRNCAIIFNARAKSRDSGSSGQGRWNSLIIPLCSVKPLGRTAFTEREGAVYTLSITPQLASYDLVGITVVSSVHGTSALRYDRVSSDYPFHAVAIQGNASATAFNLDYTPISASSAIAVVSRSQVVISSVNTTAKTATLNSAPASGARGIVLYQFSG